MSDTLPASAAATDTSPKRRAILEAAAGLFLAEGFGAVSMDGIARAAQVSKATLYAHFAGKDALFAEIVAGNCARMRGVLEVLFSSHELGLEEALTELGTQWLRFLLQPRVRALHRMVIAEAPRFPELARSFYAEGPRGMCLWLAGWLAEEQRRGQLHAAASPALAAEQFLSLLRGDLFLRATLGLSGPAGEEEVALLARQAARAIVRLHGDEGGRGTARAETDGFA
ncbi:TetR/AcrR family transcriptional regulator [Teichococcus aerofrigidensis]